MDIDSIPISNYVVPERSNSKRMGVDISEALGKNNFTSTFWLLWLSVSESHSFICVINGILVADE